MSDYPMLISNKLHSFRNFFPQRYDLSAIKKPEKQIINGLMEKSKRLSENRLAHSEKNVGVL